LDHLLKVGGIPAKAFSFAPVKLDVPQKLRGRLPALECRSRKAKGHNWPIAERTEAKEGPGWLLAEVIDRFRVTGPGQRNYQMHRAVAALFAKGLDAHTVATVMTLWHEHFDGHFQTTLADALVLLHACIKSTLKKVQEGRFKPCERRDHFQQCVRWTLSPCQQKYLQELVHGAELGSRDGYGPFALAAAVRKRPSLPSAA
jgi:hypothetical protein